MQAFCNFLSSKLWPKVNFLIAEFLVNFYTLIIGTRKLWSFGLFSKYSLPTDVRFSYMIFFFQQNTWNGLAWWTYSLLLLIWCCQNTYDLLNWATEWAQIAQGVMLLQWRAWSSYWGEQVPTLSKILLYASDFLWFLCITCADILDWSEKFSVNTLDVLFFGGELGTSCGVTVK